MRFPTTLFTVSACILALGCPLAHDPQQPAEGIPDAEVTDGADARSPQSLEELVAQTLEDNLRQRALSTNTHGAWQILHGVLAYGDQFSIDTPVGQRPAIEYLLDGNAVNGFEPAVGDQMGDPPRSGFRIDLQPATKIGQGHRDQWLAVLAQSGLDTETRLSIGDQTFTMDDWIRQAEYDVPRNLELEFSWTLIALTAYRDTDHRWIGRDGVEYATTDLLDSELQQSIPTSVCGGTHRLIGIAMSLNKRRAEGKPINGVWADAQSLLAESVASAEKNQNPDGSYSVAYLHRPGWTRDLGESLGTTGHVLEFLAFAAPDETLRQPWVQRSVRRLCQILDECQDVDLECGVLYHALHGLSEYQQRISKMNSPS